MDTTSDIRAGVAPVDNETHCSASRVTADDRKLTYRLKVLQQPQRARACGQGAKSSADRRPVDPPPIVELRIFQGEGQNETDITFTISANYFLFATLEAARPIAHGRVHSDRQIPPVLTGTPVAGMVYLDRPSQAGYFIFPDLSVRHEGKYRLLFSLYEDLKSAKDEDKSLDMARPPTNMEDAHVTHRLDVRSEPFMVYSAKKFPGLTESTALSRVVAEQGCRVRIRRDVRMRRRDTKDGSREWDPYEAQTAHARARLSATPDPSRYGMSTPHGYGDPIARPRSSSLTSHHSLSNDHASRRPSMNEFANPYPPSSYSASSSHAGPGAYSQPHAYPQSAAPYQQSAYMPQAPPMAPPVQAPYSIPPQPLHATPGYYGYPAHTAAPATPSPGQHIMPNSYESANQHSHRGSDYAGSIQGTADHLRRPSFGGSLPNSSPASYAQSSYTQPPHYTAPGAERPNVTAIQPDVQPPYAPSQDMYARPAPVEPLAARTTSNGPPSTTRPSMSLPPINMSMIPNGSNGSPVARLEASSPVSATVLHHSHAPSTSSIYYPSAQPQHHQADSHKRSYGHVFSDRHQEYSLRQGARPSSALEQSALGAVDDDDNSTLEMGADMVQMQYRRADGRQIRRALPTHS